MNKGQYIVFNGRKHHVKNRKLNLSELGIKSLSEVRGLGSLVGLKSLNLKKNQLSKIEGLDALSELENLVLSLNKIKKIY